MTLQEDQSWCARQQALLCAGTGSGLLQMNQQANIQQYTGAKPQIIVCENPQLNDTVVKPIKKEQSMLGTISQDLKKFIVEHKSTIYVLAVLILADHLLFQGQFRERLHKMMSTLLGKVETMIEKKHE